MTVGRSLSAGQLRKQNSRTNASTRWGCQPWHVPDRKQKPVQISSAPLWLCCTGFTQSLEGERPPNVLALHQAFEDNRYVYIINDSCAEESLSSQHFGALPETVVAGLAFQIIDTIAHCHQRGELSKDCSTAVIVCTCACWLVKSGLLRNGVVAYACNLQHSHIVPCDNHHQTSACTLVTS